MQISLLLWSIGFFLHGAGGFLRFGHLLIRLVLSWVHAGVGVVSLKGAPLTLRSSATVQFRAYF